MHLAQYIALKWSRNVSLLLNVLCSSLEIEESKPADNTCDIKSRKQGWDEIWGGGPKRAAEEPKKGNEWLPIKSAAAAAAKSLQSCPTLSDPMDCGLPGSSIHGIFQAKVLERGAIAFYLLRTYHMPGTIQCIQYTAERKTNVEKKSCPHGVYTSGVELRGKQRVKKPGRWDFQGSLSHSQEGMCLNPRKTHIVEK